MMPPSQRLAVHVLGLLLACCPALALAQSPARVSSYPDRLRIAFPKSVAEPYLLGHGEFFANPPGLLVDWVRTALRQMGCAADLVRLPARRTRALLEAGQLDLVAGVAEGGPLGSLLVLPPHEGARGEFDLGLGRVEYVLYARRDSPASWDGRQLLLPEGARVGVSQGSRSERLAQERGWPVDPAPGSENGLQKLLAGRTSVMLSHNLFLRERLAREPGLAAQVVQLEPAIEARSLQVGASPEFARRQPEFIAQLWRALCRQSQETRLDGACRLPPGDARPARP